MGLEVCRSVNEKYRIYNIKREGQDAKSGWTRAFNNSLLYKQADNGKGSKNVKG